MSRRVERHTASNKCGHMWKMFVRNGTNPICETNGIHPVPIRCECVRVCPCKKPAALFRRRNIKKRKMKGNWIKITTSKFQIGKCAVCTLHILAIHLNRLLIWRPHTIIIIIIIHICKCTYKFFVMDNIIIEVRISVSIWILLAIKETILQNWWIALNCPRYIVLISVIAQRWLKCARKDVRLEWIIK